MKKFAILMLSVFLFSSGLASAERQPSDSGSQPGGQPPQMGQGRPNGPPPEAIKACNNLTRGAACQFAGRGGEQISGTCDQPPPPPPDREQSKASVSGEVAANTPVLACRPANIPAPPHGKRPPGSAAQG